MLWMASMLGMQLLALVLILVYAAAIHWLELCPPAHMTATVSDHTPGMREVFA